MAEERRTEHGRPPKSGPKVGRVLGANPHGLPPWVVVTWQTTVLRVKGLFPAERLWQAVLTADDRRRLGGDLAAAYGRDGGAAGMWRKLRGGSVPQAVVGVATALNLLDGATGAAVLRALGEAPADPAGAVDHAVAGGGLVVAESPPRAWWAGEELAVDWATRDQPWRVLVELARRSKAGGAVDRLVFDAGGITDPRYVSKQVSRLRKLAGFPADLGKAIVRTGRGTYRLTLPPDRIRVFESGSGDAPREWLP